MNAADKLAALCGGAVLLLYLLIDSVPDLLRLP